MGDVDAHLALADLQLEDAVAAGQRLPLGNVARGVAAGQGPGDGHVIAHAAPADQSETGTPSRLPAMSSSAVSTAHLAKWLPRTHWRPSPWSRRHGDIAGLQDRDDVGVDGGLDAFRAFRAIAEAADGGAFADPLDTVGIGQADDHHRLRMHGAMASTCGRIVGTSTIRYQPGSTGPLQRISRMFSFREKSKPPVHLQIIVVHGLYLKGILS
jgi:hypothetical protein